MWGKSMERTDGDLEAVKRELKPLVSGGSYENILLSGFAQICG
jgi:hypothetical protein